jgi:glycine/D-amino acid oxidase-like deaminating enzyme
LGCTPVNRIPSVDVQVCIVGAGVLGLLTALKLVQLGISVALVEKESRIASGPSSKNEGWGHMGTYHAISVRDRSSAIRVAQRCIRGCSELAALVPQAIDESDVPMFALLRDESRLDQVISRWNEAEVQYREVSPQDLLLAVPELRMEAVSRAFKVADRSINTPILYAGLLNRIEQTGTPLYLETRLDFSRDSQVNLQLKTGDRISLSARLFLYTAGFGIRDIFRDQFNIPLPIRFWKSHLVITSRLSNAGVFYLDPGEAALMHHDDKTIVGLNEDAVPVVEPDYEPMGSKIAAVRDAVRRLFVLSTDFPTMAVACIKSDVERVDDSSRSLDIFKAPVLANHLAQQIFRRLGNPRISRRPCDDFSPDVLGPTVSVNPTD